MGRLAAGVARLAVPVLLAASLAAPPGARAAAGFTPPSWQGPPGRLVMGGTWLYRPDPGNAGLSGTFPRSVATAGWSPVTIPNAWNGANPSAASNAGGVGWYRRDFTLPSRRAGLTWLVRFESVNYRARVFLNGRELGTHAGAAVPWELRLPGVRRTGTNRLVVRVDSRRRSTDLPAGPGGGWWNYGGLLREVELRHVDGVDMPQVDARPVLACPTCAATVTVRAALRSYAKTSRRVHVSGTFGGVRLSFPPVTLRPGASAAVRGRIVVKHPELWSPARPALYNVHVRAGSAVDSFNTGIRSITVKRGLLYLNGHRLHLRGVGLHDDSPVRGAAIDQSDREAFMRRVKDLGATLVRAHYPLHPAFQDLADQDGVLLWSEIPAYGLREPALARPSVRAHALALLRANIATNGNHPSVLAWSVGNELPPSPGPGQTAYLRAATKLVHTLDPTRPAAYAFAGYPGAGCHPGAYAGVGLLGVNDYFGWYTRQGQIADREALPGYLASVRRCYKRQAIMVTEVGAEANRDGPVEEKGTYAFQSDFAKYHYGVFARTPWLAGATWWALQEFRVSPNWSGGNPRPSPPLHTKGLLSFAGVPKPVYAVVRAIYRATRQYGSWAPGTPGGSSPR
jgi:beta-glucuronidase